MEEANYILLAWGAAAVLILVGIVVCGRAVRSEQRYRWAGIIVDERNRFSLSRLQVVLWTIVVASLIAGVAAGRLADAGETDQALEFTIPPELWGVMGISVGSTAAATVIKLRKDGDPNANPFLRTDSPSFIDLVTVEEGEGTGKLIDVGKFQNIWFTLILIAAYVVQAIVAIQATSSADNFNALPAFTSSFLIVLGISHAGYLAVKLPDRPGKNPGAGFKRMSTNP